MHKAIIIFSVLILAVTLNSCSEKTVSACPGNWTGKYSYGEEPIKAMAGYAMSMQWELSVNDSCQGVLEVNGLQTYLKLLTAVSGDRHSVAFIYEKLFDGVDYGLEKGDTLFILSKVEDKLVTRWKGLESRLSENPPQECNCFTLSKNSK